MEIIKKDLSVKILSIFLAILFWIFVLNIDNPYEYDDVDVPVKILNKDSLEEKGLYLKNEQDIPQTVKVRISGRKAVTATIGASDIVVELDFSKIDSVDDTKIKINQPYFVSPKKDVKINGFTPQTVNLKLERILGNSFPITVETTGNLKPGYKIVNMSYSPESVPLMYQESVISTVNSIKAVVDITNVDRSIEKKVPCKVYNKAGKEINAFKNLAVDVKIEVGKQVPVTAVIKGKPAEDYVEVRRTISPATAVIEGDPQIIGGVTEVKTEPINIENAIADQNITAQLKLPEGVKLVGGQKEISINIIIQKYEQKDITIGKDSITVIPPANSALSCEIRTESITLPVKGLPADLQNVNLSNLKPTVDLSAFEAGTHKVQLQVTLPSQVKLVQNAEVEVKIG